MSMLRFALESTEAEGVLDGAQRLVVGPHRGRDRPVGGIVGGCAHPVTGRDPVLGLVEVAVDHRQALQRRHRRRIGVDGGHVGVP